MCLTSGRGCSRVACYADAPGRRVPLSDNRSMFRVGMTRSPRRKVLVAALLVIGCDRAAPAGASAHVADTTRPVAVTPAPVQATGNAGPPRAAAADTFDLATVAGVTVPEPMPLATVPCPLERVFLSRYVLKADSTYEWLYSAAAGCGAALAEPMTTRHEGRYAITHDTLTAYSGDGSEEFQQFIARWWVDSLVGEGRTGPWRYLRRRVPSAARKAAPSGSTEGPPSPFSKPD